MTAAEELRNWLAGLRRRMALDAVIRGCAVLVAVALGATVVVVVLANRQAFSPRSVLHGRLALVAALALCALLGLALPLWRLTRAFVVRQAERQVPQFGARLRTFSERQAAEPGPFMDLLAADTLRVVSESPRPALVPALLAAVLGGIGLASLGGLLWLVSAGPGYLGYGAALVWGAPHGGPLYDIKVGSGDGDIRRHADFLVSAQTVGLDTRDVRLHVKVGGGDWQDLPMQPQPLSSRFRYLLAALPDNAEYWVAAGALASPHYHVRVSDVPVVRQVRVTYHYPAWTGLPDLTEEHASDLRAVQGTQATLDITTDQPLTDGKLVLDDGHQLALQGTGTQWHAQLDLARDGAWHVTTRERSRDTRITPDWIIEATPPGLPLVAIVRPQAEYRASPIEEVTIAAQAADDFGLKQFELRWSVNGGPEQSADLLARGGAKQARGAKTLSLEELKLAPGDVVSVYALARDARAEARSDIAFVQADPFEREFSQGQAAGGGGGGGAGNQQAEISRREKEIITGTWAQLSGTARSAAPAGPAGAGAAGPGPAEQAAFLSEVQGTLRQQAESLAGRLQARDLPQANEQFGSFEREMGEAAAAMAPAAVQLKAQRWREAVTAEQQALQHLLRAEATFREIQVAFGSRGGGGGGNMGRDLASLSDLELDTNKNQYETAQNAQPGQPGQQEQARVDEALRKLDELARQQQQLADQPAAGRDAAEQRWNQEMLRRNAQELQRQLQQLADNQRGQGSGAQQGGPQQDGAQAGGSPQDDSQQDGKGEGQTGGQRAGQPQSGGRQGAGQRGGARPGDGGNAQAGDDALRQAQQQMQAALDAMRRAAAGGDPAGAKRAAEDLRAALATLGGAQRRQQVAQLDGLARQADQLAARAKDQQQQLRGMTQSPDALADKRQQLADDVNQLAARLRDAQSEVQKNSREAERHLREALGALDAANTVTRLQSSADQLRRGFSVVPNRADDNIAGELAQLAQQVRQAGAAAASGAPDQQDAAQQGMQAFVARLQRLDPRGTGGPQDTRGQGDGQGEGQGKGGPPGNGRGGGQGEPRGGAGLLGGRVTGAGGGGEGNIDGGWNTGDNRYGSQVRAGAGVENRAGAAAGASDPARQRDYDQGLADLAGVRRAVADDPEMRRQVDELVQAMQKLDPRRFPGNPELVDQLFAQVRSGVDRLELRLGQDPGATRGAVRSVAAPVVPDGYQSAVADYYRRLSRGQ